MSISPTNFTPSPLSLSPQQRAQERVTSFMKHAYKMIDLLENQYNFSVNGSDAIFASLRESLAAHHMEVAANPLLAKEGALSKKEIKELNKLLHATQDEMIEQLQSALIRLTKQKAGFVDGSKQAHYVKLLALGGFRAKFVRVLSGLSKTNNAAREALDKFSKATTELSNANWRSESFDFDSLDGLGREKNIEFIYAKNNQNDLARRHGVLYNESFSMVKLTFSKKKLAKQLKSLDAQLLSSKVRQTITKPLDFQGTQATSRLTPLNEEFDKTEQVFGNIFGRGGISAANRQEAHLINGYDSRMMQGDREIFSALRHGILSDKYEQDQAKRKENSKAAAAELVAAAYMKQCERLGLTMEEARNRDPPLTLVLNSVSLVTPDLGRSLASKGASERDMLRDQMEALESLVGHSTEIEVGGQKISVNLQVNAFNFGVNAGAVGKLKWAPGVKLGLDTQYKYNLKALEGLESQFNEVFNSMSVTDPRVNEMQNLMADIQHLMRNKKAYLEGGNQYEIGAKIVILTNLMNEVKGFGAEAAFNCMSGKDRTGVMDAVARTFAVMRERGDHFPTHEELMENTNGATDQFREIFSTMLEHYGGLEVTEMNTGALGFKVSGEANLYGIDKEIFETIRGLSKTTGA